MGGMETVRVRYDGKAFVPTEPVDVPVGSEYELPLGQSAVAGEPAETFEDLLDALDKLPSDPDAPVDGAAQVDHYLYGTPKRP